MGLRRDEQTDALFRSILSLKSIEECYCYFEDLCTNKEVRDFGQRLEIAKELELGRPYPERELKRCLDYGPGGYRMVLDRLKEETPQG